MLNQNQSTDPGSMILQPAGSVSQAKTQNTLNSSNNLQPTISQNQALVVQQLQSEGLGPQTLPPNSGTNWWWLLILAAALAAVWAARYLWQSSKVPTETPKEWSKSTKKVGKKRG